MTLRIEKISEGGKTIFRVSGRIGMEHLVERDDLADQVGVRPGRGPGQ